MQVRQRSGSILSTQIGLLTSGGHVPTVTELPQTAAGTRALSVPIDSGSDSNSCVGPRF